MQSSNSYDWREAKRMVQFWKDSGFTIVFTNGCFDLLHRGHIALLYGAKKLGDKLIVGLNSDHSVNRLKGEGRPIKEEVNRLAVLEALEMVDLVIVFDQNTPLNLIKEIGPDILVKGADYKDKEIVGREWVEESGGEVILLPLVKGCSTTSIIKSITK